MSGLSQQLLQFDGGNQAEIATFCQQAYFALEDQAVSIETLQGAVELEPGDYVVRVDEGFQILSKAMVKAIQPTPELTGVDREQLLQQLLQNPSAEMQERNACVLKVLKAFK